MKVVVLVEEGLMVRLGLDLLDELLGLVEVAEDSVWIVLVVGS